MNRIKIFSVQDEHRLRTSILFGDGENTVPLMNDYSFHLDQVLMTKQSRHMNFQQQRSSKSIKDIQSHDQVLTVDDVEFFINNTIIPEVLGFPTTQDRNNGSTTFLPSIREFESVSLLSELHDLMKASAIMKQILIDKGKKFQDQQNEFQQEQGQPSRLLDQYNSLMKNMISSLREIYNIRREMKFRELQVEPWISTILFSHIILPSPLSSSNENNNFNQQSSPSSLLLHRLMDQVNSTSEEWIEFASHASLDLLRKYFVDYYFSVNDDEEEDLRNGDSEIIEKVRRRNEGKICEYSIDGDSEGKTQHLRFPNIKHFDLIREWVVPDDEDSDNSNNEMHSISPAKVTRIPWWANAPRPHTTHTSKIEKKRKDARDDQDVYHMSDDDEGDDNNHDEGVTVHTSFVSSGWILEKETCDRYVMDICGNILERGILKESLPMEKTRGGK